MKFNTIFLALQVAATGSWVHTDELHSIATEAVVENLSLDELHEAIRQSLLENPHVWYEEAVQIANDVCHDLQQKGY